MILIFCHNVCIEMWQKREITFMGGHGFRSRRQMFTCMVCTDDVGELLRGLLQNLLEILPFNLVAKNMGQGG